MIRVRRGIDLLSVVIALGRRGDDPKRSLEGQLDAVIDGVAEIDVAADHAWEEIKTFFFEPLCLRLLVCQHDIVGA